MFESEQALERSQIINLTKHPATPEQILAGVVDLPDQVRKDIKKWTFFPHVPTLHDIGVAASEIVKHLEDVEINTEMVLIGGGAPWLLPTLRSMLVNMGKRPMMLYTKTVWNSQKQRQERRHGGFIPLS